MTMQLVTCALMMASMLSWSMRYIVESSNRGSQYTSDRLQQLLGGLSINGSMI
jgi:isocitrate dehydrogenase